MANFLLDLAARSASWLPNPLRKQLYKLGPLTSWIRRSLNRAAPKGIVEVRVAAGPLQGLPLLLDLQSEKDYWLGTYEPELQAAIQAFGSEGMTAFDCGANIGYISLALARKAGLDGNIFSFEPLPENQQRLRANLAMNAGSARLTVVPAAVTDASQTIEFLVHTSGAMGKASGSAGRQVVYGETITVDGVALDDFVYLQGNPAPALIKMDIEGGEVLALKGMGRLLREAQPILLLELHGPESAQVAWTSLTGVNYTIHALTKGFPQVDAVNKLDWKAYLAALPNG
jgi:FkbM family methyltransferase